MFAVDLIDALALHVRLRSSTSLAQLATVGRAIGLGPDPRVVDFGCGRGEALVGVLPQQQQLAREDLAAALEPQEIDPGGDETPLPVAAVPGHGVQTGGKGALSQRDHRLTAEITNPQPDLAGLIKPEAHGHGAIGGVGVGRPEGGRSRCGRCWRCRR